MLLWTPVNVLYGVREVNLRPGALKRIVPVFKRLMRGLLAML
jgi:hypothetical protein